MRQRADGHLRRVFKVFDEGCSCVELAQQRHGVETTVGEAVRELIHDHVDHRLDAAANETGEATIAVVNEFKAISKNL